MSEQQRDYVWQSLHELELIELIAMLKQGTIWTPLIEHFSSVEVEYGLYECPGRESHGRPYVRLYRIHPDGSQHTNMIGPIDAP